MNCLLIVQNFNFLYVAGGDAEMMGVETGNVFDHDKANESVDASSTNDSILMKMRQKGPLVRSSNFTPR